MKLTARMKERGEDAVLRMSKKAQDFYNETDPLDVYGDFNVFNEPIFVVKSWDGISEPKTFEEVQWLFEQWYDTVHQDD